MDTVFSLKVRIAATIFVLEGLMMGFTLWQVLGALHDSVEKQVVTQEQVTLDLLKNLSLQALVTEEFAELQPSFESLQRDRRIARALLADATGRIVAASNPVDLGRPLPGLDPEGGTNRRTQLIGRPADPLGTLALDFSSAPLEQAGAAARNLGIAIATVCMLLIALVGIVTGWLLTRRLERLRDAAGKMAQGDFDVRTRLAGRDEVAALSRSFDRMAERIAADQDRLQAANALLEQRIAERTAELAAANRELEAFSYSVSHDLRAPLRAISGFSAMALKAAEGNADPEMVKLLERIRSGAERMGHLIDDLLGLSRVSRHQIQAHDFNLSEVAGEIVTSLIQAHPERSVQVTVQPDMMANGDPSLVRIALENLIGNAWKFTSCVNSPRIQIGSEKRDGEQVYFVRDNGAGFDMQYANKLFGAFQRLHTQDEFEGTGIGLAIVQRVVARHGGQIRGEGVVGRGASFYFTLPGMGEQQARAGDGSGAAAAPAAP